MVLLYACPFGLLVVMLLLDALALCSQFGDLRLELRSVRRAIDYLEEGSTYLARLLAQCPLLLCQFLTFLCLLF